MKKSHLKNICEVCKDFFKSKPNFVKKIKPGMKLESWFSNAYDKEWQKRDKCCSLEIIRVEEDMVFVRFDGSDEIRLYIPEFFLETQNNGYTEIKDL